MSSVWNGHAGHSHQAGVWKWLSEGPPETAAWPRRVSHPAEPAACRVSWCREARLPLRYPHTALVTQGHPGTGPEVAHGGWGCPGQSPLGPKQGPRHGQLGRRGALEQLPRSWPQPASSLRGSERLRPGGSFRPRAGCPGRKTPVGTLWDAGRGGG